MARETAGSPAREKGRTQAADQVNGGEWGPLDGERARGEPLNLSSLQGPICSSLGVSKVVDSSQPATHTSEPPSLQRICEIRLGGSAPY